jgi:biopolymer transport protein ExbD
MGSFSRSKSTDLQGLHDVNLTPLIDVSLVLVVILLVATPLAFQSSLAVHTAAASSRNAAQRVSEDRVEVKVHAAGGVTVNRMKIEDAGMPQVLESLLAASSTQLVVVRCEDDVPHGRFVHVLDEARRAGAKSIAVVGGAQ